jgi:uridine kinase
VIEPLVERIVAERARVEPRRAVLVALSGIDGSGKGFVAAQVARALEARGLRVALINIDGWLNLPQVRFSDVDPARHFYDHAIRFDEMFSQLVLPLRERRSLVLDAELAPETATAYVAHRYAFHDVDVIVLEGVYLLKRALRAHHDVSAWIDCTFETALERALARGQEGLPAEEAIAAYRTIYFPAQEIHLAEDAPRAAASVLLVNDPRLEGNGAR